MSDNGSFVRVLGRKDVLAVGFGSMIGFGWVVLAGEFIAQAGTAGSALAFAIGGAIVCLVGLTYAELVSAMPKAGGEHNYALRALGARPAFVTSWAVVIGYVSVVAFEAVALPETIAYLLPDMPGPTLWTIAGSPVHSSWVLIGVLGAAIMTLVNYIGIRPASVFQSIGVMFLLAVGATMLFGLFIGGSPVNAEPLFTGGTPGVLAVVVVTPFLFLGFDVIPQSAEEAAFSRRRIGHVLVFSVVLATAWYVLVQLTVGFALPSHESAGAELATADAMTALWGTPVMGQVLVLGGIAGILTSWNGLLIGASRLIYAMASSGMLPAWFGRLHPKYRTPGNAVLFIGGISCISPFFGDQMLTWLSNAGSTNIVLGYLLVGVSFLVLRKREPQLERPYRVGPARTVGVLAVVLSGGLIVLCLPGMPAALAWPQEWLLVGALWILGLVFVLRVPRVRAGPEAEHHLLQASGRIG
ncbi:APC family permease [Saccharopolyspora sp. HNM0983]|uniref:APC family permease n=1 Tax=Saccharopolyspora montiporae TaxID=2781240 RepID=A0A929B9K9_9PSEU|nr:APC family permease [Saccharopolyspora sp. HNM0983]MBE9375784.1 APC family permease [Saccharopolyspora sp. HNM0983]